MRQIKKHLTSKSALLSGGLFLLAHSLIAVVIFFKVIANQGIAQAEFAWFPLMRLDWPMSDFAFEWLGSTLPMQVVFDLGYPLVGSGPNLRMFVLLGLAGGLQWFVIGSALGACVSGVRERFSLQLAPVTSALAKYLTMRHALRLIIGGVIGFLCIRYGIYFALAPRPYSATKGFYIPNSSMEPSIKKGDRIFVLKYGATGHEPERLEPVVFQPADDPQIRIARIVGLPGETVQIREGKVLINSRPLPSNLTYTDMGGPYGWNTEVQPGTYFLLADNGSSNDSRFIGPVPRIELIGAVKQIYWPIWRVGAPSNPSLDRPAAR